MSIFKRHVDMAMGTCNRAFGHSVFYCFKESPGLSHKITGIFEAEGIVVDTSGDIPVETRHPVLCIRRSDLERISRHPKKGDSVLIDGEMYEVTRTPGDAYAEMRLVLMKKGGKSYA